MYTLSRQSILYVWRIESCTDNHLPFGTPAIGDNFRREEHVTGEEGNAVVLPDTGAVTHTCGKGWAIKALALAQKLKVPCDWFETPRVPQGGVGTAHSRWGIRLLASVGGHLLWYEAVILEEPNHVVPALGGVAGMERFRFHIGCRDG